MLRFSDFEALGLRIAAMTGAADGDFSRDGRPPEEALALAGLEPRPVATLAQVHGVTIREVGAGQSPLASRPEGDGLITRDDTIAIGVRVADCVPVFLFEPELRAISAVHAGREGTVAGVASRAIEAMRDRFGVDPTRVHALIGPSAGPCCYEVSEVMAAKFRERGYATRGRYLDLWESNAKQLRDAGVPLRQISISGHCTICGGGFHSYRGSKTARRNLAVIAL